MKKNLSLVLFAFLFLFSCKTPDIVKQNGSRYVVSTWYGGEFVYITYQWKKGGFERAIELAKYFNQLTIDRKEGEEVIAMFPTKTTCKIGFIAKAPFEFSEISGYAVARENIPAGQYATMKLKGYPKSMFTYHGKFKKILKKDGYNVLSPVFEIFTYDTFNNPSVPMENRIGEIRYRISR